MLTKRWARRMLVLAVLSLLPLTVYAQATTPAPTLTAPPPADQSQPASPPETQPSQPSSPKVTPPKPASKTGKTTKQKAVTSTENTSETSADSRINLGDSRHVWHPKRSQLGFAQTGTGYKIDSGKTRAYLMGIAPYVHCLPVNASIALRSSTSTNWVGVREDNISRPAKILPGGPGINLNVDASVKAIQQAIAADSTTQHIALVVKSTPAKIDASKFAGIDSRLAHYVTHFNPGERGRTQTVRLAISLLDGHIVPPQGILSLNQTVGERTAERGFGMGIVFVSGHLDTQLGGGMCQVATTLFNTVLLANLKVVERHQHIRTVPYVNPGQDATVYWGQKDFKFQNSSDSPIYISYKTTATHAICDIYGKAVSGVKVEVKDDYHKLGPRYYTAVLKRYVTENGTTKVDYVARSAYKWTPSLDYSM